MRIIACLLLVMVVVSLVCSCNTLHTGSEADRGAEVTGRTFDNSLQIDRNGFDDHDPTAVVRLYWQLSSAGNLGETQKLTIMSPPSFESLHSRCTTDKEKRREKALQADKTEAKEATTPDELTAGVSQNPNGWQQKSLSSLAEKIADSRLVPESVKLVGSYGDEAVVSVSYLDSSLPGRATVFQYFFLYRKNDQWGIFMTVRDPNFHNANYAGQNCD